MVIPANRVMRNPMLRRTAEYQCLLVDAILLRDTRLFHYRSPFDPLGSRLRFSNCFNSRSNLTPGAEPPQRSQATFPRTRPFSDAHPFSDMSHFRRDDRSTTWSHHLRDSVLLSLHALTVSAIVMPDIAKYNIIPIWSYRPLLRATAIRCCKAATSKALCNALQAGTLAVCFPSRPSIFLNDTVSLCRDAVGARSVKDSKG